MGSVSHGGQPCKVTSGRFYCVQENASADSSLPPSGALGIYTENGEWYLPLQQSSSLSTWALDKPVLSGLSFYSSASFFLVEMAFEEGCNTGLVLSLGNSSRAKADRPMKMEQSRPCSGVRFDRLFPCTDLEPDLSLCLPSAGSRGSLHPTHAFPSLPPGRVLVSVFFVGFLSDS